MAICDIYNHHYFPPIVNDFARHHVAICLLNSLLPTTEQSEIWRHPCNIIHRFVCFKVSIGTLGQIFSKPSQKNLTVQFIPNQRCLLSDWHAVHNYFGVNSTELTKIYFQTSLRSQPHEGLQQSVHIRGCRLQTPSPLFLKELFYFLLREKNHPAIGAFREKGDLLINYTTGS